MKVVLNTRFGGFSLSELAHKKLIEYGVNVYKSNSRIDDKVFIIESNEGYYSNFHYWEHRTNPLLIKVVEELGRSASERGSQLEVIEISDGNEWVISEVGGFESVMEWQLK